MGKNRSKKKQRKHNVKKRVQKLKELTAEDLFANPSLLNSPQFKALPMEKQFQLTAQLKQMRMMSGRGMGLGIPMNVVGNKSDELYSKYLDTNSQLSKAVNENQQLRQQIEENKRQIAEQQRIKQDLKNDEQHFTNTVKQEDAMSELNRNIDKLHVKKNLHHFKTVQKDLMDTLNSHDEQIAKKIADEKQNADDDYIRQLGKIAGFDMDKANLFYEMSAIEKQRNINRMASQLAENEEKQRQFSQDLATYQQMNQQYTDNGLNDKARDTEIQIQELTQLKKNQTINDEIPEVVDETQPIEVPPPAIEHPSLLPPEEAVNDSSEPLVKQVINSNVKSQLLQDKIEDVKSELKSQQQLTQAEEAANVIQARNEHRKHVKENNERSELLTQLQKQWDGINSLALDAERLNNSDHLKPLVLESKKTIDRLSQEYGNTKDHKTKMKILRKRELIQTDVETKLKEWKKQQQDLSGQLDHIDRIQIEKCVYPDPNYMSGMKKGIKENSPTKLNLIHRKLNSDQKQIEEGNMILDRLDIMLHSINEDIMKLQAAMEEKDITGYNDQIKAWRKIAADNKNSEMALTKIKQDLLKSIQNVKDNRYSNIDYAKYKKKIDAISNEDPIDVSGYKQFEINSTDESNLNAELVELLNKYPNDFFQFKPQALKDKTKDVEIPYINYCGESLNEYISSLKSGNKKQVLKAMLHDAIYNTGGFIWDKGLKQVIKVVTFLGAGYLVLKAVPAAATQEAFKTATRFTLDIGEGIGKGLAEQGLAALKGVKMASEPEVKAIKQQLNYLYSNVTEFTLRAKADLITRINQHRQQIEKELEQSELGQKFLATLDSFDHLLPQILDAGVDTLKGILEASPTLIRALGFSITGTGQIINLGGKAVSGTEKGIKWLSEKLLNFLGIHEKEKDEFEDVDVERIRRMAEQADFRAFNHYPNQTPIWNYPYKGKGEEYYYH